MKVVCSAEYCLGCGLCRIHCAAGHDGYNDSILKAYKRGTPRPRADLVYDQDRSWLNTCQHCPDAPCINGCITGALQEDDQGVVYVDEEYCISCYTCVMLCPYGHIHVEPKAVRKCDLCRGRSGQPACVDACPNGALRLIDEGESA